MSREMEGRMTPPKQPRTGTVQLHIERLVLDGFSAPHAQLQRFAAELTRELEQRLAGVEFTPIQTSAFARSGAPAVALSAAGLDAGAAGSVAAAVISGLSAVTGRNINFSSAVSTEAALNHHNNQKPTSPYDKT